MSKPNDGGPAFPLMLENTGELTVVQTGMSLRDWFAGQALAGLCANGKGVVLNGHEVSHSKAAYLIADAMIQERSKSNG